MYKCNKVCNRGLIADDQSFDYIDTCINSTNPLQNVYDYCYKKYNSEVDKELINTCKLDMCNLCCVTMDPMKNKKYSWDNSQKCFDACATGNIL